MKRGQNGFTLIEIAIVLVIVGLLLGGILKGQEMIVQARVKNAIADFSAISVAVLGYQDRYRALPGDDRGAGRWPGAVAGNGDGVLSGRYNEPVGAGNPPESLLWWQDLRLAGFVSGAGAEQPRNAFQGLVGVQTGDGTAAMGPAMGGAAPGFTGVILCSANIPDKVAMAIDAQLDDGVHNTGAIRAQRQPGPNPDIKPVLDATADRYVEDGTGLYTVCRSPI